MQRQDHPDTIGGRGDVPLAASRICRWNNKFAEGYEYAQRGLAIPRPTSGQSIQQWIYDYALRDVSGCENPRIVGGGGDEEQKRGRWRPPVVGRPLWTVRTADRRSLCHRDRGQQVGTDRDIGRAAPGCSTAKSPLAGR